MTRTEVTCDFKGCDAKTDATMGVSNLIIGRDKWIVVIVRRQWTRYGLLDEMRHICPKHAKSVIATLGLDPIEATFAERAVDNEGGDS